MLFCGSLCGRRRNWLVGGGEGKGRGIGKGGKESFSLLPFFYIFHGKLEPLTHCLLVFVYYCYSNFFIIIITSPYACFILHVKFVS